MTTNYVTYKNQSCTNYYGSPFCDTIYSAILAATTDTLLTVPLTAAMGAPVANQYNKFLAVIVTDDAFDVYIALNAVAAAPAGAAFAATTSELIPRNVYCAKVVKAGDVIHFFSSGASNVTVSFFAIQE